MWHFAQCAVAGRGHIAAGIPCQDKTYAVEQDGVSVIVLADGAGSARFSHEGAEIVCREAAKLLIQSFDSYYEEEDAGVVKRAVLQHLLATLKQEAELLECDIEDLASTLLLAAIKEERCILMHLGDGVIGCLKGGEMRVASHPDNGEFINSTEFVTSPSAISSLRIRKGESGDIAGFVLMSDGAEESLYDRHGKVLAPAVRRILDFAAVLSHEKMEAELLDSFEGVIRQRTMDDCSLVLIVRDHAKMDSAVVVALGEEADLLGMPSGDSAESLSKDS